MKNYQVIGGQYEQHWYGESDSLRGAKSIATRHEEYWHKGKNKRRQHHEIQSR